jgi:hypothetical protein
MAYATGHEGHADEPGDAFELGGVDEPAWVSEPMPEPILVDKRDEDVTISALTREQLIERRRRRGK